MHCKMLHHLYSAVGAISGSLMKIWALKDLDDISDHQQETLGTPFFKYVCVPRSILMISIEPVTQKSCRIGTKPTQLQLYFKKV